MNTLLTQNWTSITDFKKQPSQSFEESQGEAFAILTRDKILGYMISEKRMAELLEAEENEMLRPIIEERSSDVENHVEGSIEQLFPGLAQKC